MAVSLKLSGDYIADELASCVRRYPTANKKQKVEIFSTVVSAMRRGGFVATLHPDQDVVQAGVHANDLLMQFVNDSEFVEKHALYDYQNFPEVVNWMRNNVDRMLRCLPENQELA